MAMLVITRWYKVIYTIYHHIVIDYIYMLSYTIIYHHIPSYSHTIIYHHIPYTIYYLTRWYSWRIRPWVRCHSSRGFFFRRLPSRNNVSGRPLSAQDGAGVVGCLGFIGRPGDGDIMNEHDMRKPSWLVVWNIHISHRKTIGKA